MIPKVIHFVWIGGPMPVWAHRNVQEFAKLNPHYSISVHDESSLLPELSVAYSRAYDNASKSDLIRYSILLRQGGWYFDVDFWPLRSLDDAERAWGLDGSKLFLSVCQNNVNPSMKYANGVLACSPGNPAMRRMVDRCYQNKPDCRNSFGPVLLNELVPARPQDFVVSDGAWWFPVSSSESYLAYSHLLSGDEGNVAMRRGTSGTRPYAVHLWATATSEQLEQAVRVPGEKCRPTAIVAATSREDHPLSAIADGLADLGFSVVRSSDTKSFGCSWCRPSVVVCWNGMKDTGLPMAASRNGIPVLYVEHGFMDRGEYSQADWRGILHWSSWSKKTASLPPAGARSRLAALRPVRVASSPRKGYVLVLGQLPHDTQTLDSEVPGSVLLQTHVKRALPPGTPAYFRPHPLDNYSPHPMHDVLPVLPGAQDADWYKKEKHGIGLGSALAGASFVVTINSNSLVEAMCAGVPCLAFGPCIGIDSGAVKKASVSTLATDLAEMLDGWCPIQDSVDKCLEWMAARQWSNKEFSEGSCLVDLLSEAGVEVPWP